MCKPLTPEDILNEVRQKAAEYIEMYKDPEIFISGILARKIVDLHSYIEYLEARIEQYTND